MDLETGPGNDAVDFLRDQQESEPHLVQAHGQLKAQKTVSGSWGQQEEEQASMNQRLREHSRYCMSTPRDHCSDCQN